jgi:transposase InsO family protein
MRKSNFQLRIMPPLRGRHDQFSRKVLVWRLSNSMDAGLKVKALKEALSDSGILQIFNTTQVSPFIDAIGSTCRSTKRPRLASAANGAELTIAL